MKMEKKHWAMLIVGLVALYLVWYFFLRKKGTESSFDNNLMIMGDQSSYMKCKQWVYTNKGWVCSEKPDESSWKAGYGDKCNCRPGKNNNCPCGGTLADGTVVSA